MLETIDFFFILIYSWRTFSYYLTNLIIFIFVNYFNTTFMHFDQMQRSLIDMRRSFQIKKYIMLKNMFLMEAGTYVWTGKLIIKINISDLNNRAILWIG